MKYKIGQIVTVDHPYYAGPVKMKITGFDGPRNSDEITSITCDVADDGYPKDKGMWAELEWIRAH